MQLATNAEGLKASAGSRPIRTNRAPIVLQQA